MKKLLFTLLIIFILTNILNADNFKSNNTNNEKFSIYEKYISIQKEGQHLIYRSIRSLKTDFKFLNFLLLFLITMGFGFLHSLGPGHGKALVAAYFLKRKTSDISVVNLSLIISMVHSGSAIFLAVLLSTILSSIKGIARIKMQGYFSFGSGILVVLVGTWFLISKIRGKEIGNINENVNIKRQSWLVGISAGIVPCPLALMIMLITIPAQIVWIGITSVIGISIGMFLLLFIVGELSMRSRNKVVQIFEKDSSKVTVISEVLSYISISAIIVLGLGITLFFFPLK